MIILTGHPEHFLIRMDSIVNNHVTHESLIVPCYGDPNVVWGKIQNGVHLNGENQYIDIGNYDKFCLGNLKYCYHGYTGSQWIKFDEFVEDDYYISTGDDGINVYYRNGKLHVTFDEGGKIWEVELQDDLHPEQWYFLEYTWHPDSGLQVFVNNDIVGDDPEPSDSVVRPDRGQNHFYIGKENEGASPGGRFHYPRLTIDNVEVWYATRDYLIANDYILRGRSRGLSPPITAELVVASTFAEPRPSWLACGLQEGHLTTDTPF